MTSPRPAEILILADSQPRIASDLAERLPDVSVVCWHPDGTLTRNGMAVEPGSVAPVAGWIGSDIFFGGHIDAYAEALAGFDSMRWVQSAHAGLDHRVYPMLAGNGIRLSKSSAQSLPIAEYVLAHVLHHWQGIDRRRAAQDAREWKGHQFRELWHTTWLIVGFGHIGRGVARRAKAFDCNVVAIRRSPGAPADQHADVVARLDSLPEHLPDADVVVLACPATDETRGLADAAFFSSMKESAVLVNVARGSLVDEAALLASLDQGRPERAILDVFETEPLPPQSPLWTHPKVTVTAHTSNAGGGTKGRGDALFLSNLERFLRGEAASDEVDPASLG